MNILMLTNTFTPHVGGVARSVAAFTDAYRQLGHQVLVVAPMFRDVTGVEQDVLRVPAIEHFRRSNFSVPMPSPARLHRELDRFRPDVVHSHHPFLLGDTALRVAASRKIPVVFTYHTQYDKYTHYLPGDSGMLRQFVARLAAGYANLCDAVIAPSQTVRDMLCQQQGVRSRVEVIPTGVDIEFLSGGDGRRMRASLHIPPDAVVVGHVGRLAPEKNLEFLAGAVAHYLRQNPRAWFLVAGVGPSADEVHRTLAGQGVDGRLKMLGILSQLELRDTYAAMDVFAFASTSETQGMVLVEALAAGVPVVAVDAAGVRETVEDRRNGRLLAGEDTHDFVAALDEVCSLPPGERSALARSGHETAQRFSQSTCAAQALRLYATCIDAGREHLAIHDSLWWQALRQIEREWKIWGNLSSALTMALMGPYMDKDPPPSST